MSPKKLDSTAGRKKHDPDFINAEIALKRSAKKARQLAQQSGVGVIVLQRWQDHGRKTGSPVMIGRRTSQMNRKRHWERC